MLILGIGGLVEARFITDDSFDYIRYVLHQNKVLVLTLSKTSYSLLSIYQNFESLWQG